MLIIRVVSSLSQTLQFSLVISRATELLIHTDTRMIYGPVGLVRRHFLLGSFLLVPMVSGLAHAFEILCLLSRNSVALSYHYLTLTLAHSRVLLGVMLTVRSTLNESGRKFDSVRDAWLLVSYRRSIDGGRLAILHIVLLLPYTHHRHLVHWYD